MKTGFYLFAILLVTFTIMMSSNCMKIFYTEFSLVEEKSDAEVFENWKVDYCISANDYNGKLYKNWFGGFVSLELTDPLYGEFITPAQWRTSNFLARIDSIEINVDGKYTKDIGKGVFKDSSTTITVANRHLGNAFFKIQEGLFVPDDVNEIEIKVYCCFKRKNGTEIINKEKVLRLIKKKEGACWIPIGA